jgi:hypothetical protein
VKNELWKHSISVSRKVSVADFCLFLDFSSYINFDVIFVFRLKSKSAGFDKFSQLTEASLINFTV